MPYKDLPECLVLEFVGTLCLVVFAASTGVASYLIPGMNPYKEQVFIATTVGLVVGVATFLYGKISGAHINSSVSLAHAVAGLMPRKMFFPYLVVQILAGVVAGPILYLAFHTLNSPTHFGSTKIQDGATPFTGTVLEIIGTLLLTLATLVSSSSLKGKPARQAILCGFTIFILTIIIGPFSGASFNPSRSLGPAIASQLFKNQIVFWVGPWAGAIVAGLIFAARKKYSELGSKETKKKQEIDRGSRKEVRIPKNR
ncbi:MAG: MIP/aquaporin family protein [Nitrososphaerales archaeon]